MSNRTYMKVGIIGLGKIAGFFDDFNLPVDAINSHASAISCLDNIQLAALCDTSEEKLNVFSNKWGVQNTFSKLSDLLSHSKLNVLCICTPDVSHFELVKEVLLSSNRPDVLLIEKPICCNEYELQQIEMLANKANDCSIIVNHSRRFDFIHRNVRDLIRSNELGRLLDLRWVYYGGWLHNGVHVVDTLRMLLDSDFTVFNVAEGANAYPNDPCLDVELKAINHPSASIKIESFPETAYQLFETELRFEKGRIRLEDFGNKVIVEDVRVNAAGEKELEKRDVSAMYGCGAKNAMINLYSDLEEYIKNGNEEVKFISGLDTVLKTMEIIYHVKKQ